MFAKSLARLNGRNLGALIRKTESINLFTIFIIQHYKLIIVKAARIPLLIKTFKLRSYSHSFQLDQMAEWKGVGLRRRM